MASHLFCGLFRGAPVGRVGRHPHSASPTSKAVLKPAPQAYFIPALALVRNLSPSLLSWNQSHHILPPYQLYLAARDPFPASFWGRSLWNIRYLNFGLSHQCTNITLFTLLNSLYLEALVDTLFIFFYPKLQLHFPVLVCGYLW